MGDWVCDGRPRADPVCCMHAPFGETTDALRVFRVPHGTLQLRLRWLLPLWLVLSITPVTLSSPPALVILLAMLLCATKQRRRRPHQAPRQLQRLPSLVFCLSCFFVPRSTCHASLCHEARGSVKSHVRCDTPTAASAAGTTEGSSRRRGVSAWSEQRVRRLRWCFQVLLPWFLASWI